MRKLMFLLLLRPHAIAAARTIVFSLSRCNVANVANVAIFLLNNRDAPNMPLTMFGRSRIFWRTGRTSTEVRPNFGRLLLFYDE